MKEIARIDGHVTRMADNEHFETGDEVISTEDNQHKGYILIFKVYTFGIVAVLNDGTELDISILKHSR